MVGALPPRARRLQRLHDEAAKDGLVIMGVNGEARTVLAEVRKHDNLRSR